MALMWKVADCVVYDVLGRNSPAPVVKYTHQSWSGFKETFLRHRGYLVKLTGSNGRETGEQRDSLGGTIVYIYM